MGQFDHSRMEKEATLEANWHSAGAMPRPDLGPGSAADQLPQCFFSLNGKQPLPRYPNLESALSSLVSSPSSHPAPAANGAVIGELTGRLGTICNSGEISPPAHHRSASTSCYSTPLNSPPKLNISAIDYRQRGHIGLPLPMPVSPMPGAYSVPFSVGPWFVEAASRDPRVGGMLSGVSNNESEKAFSGSRIGAPKIGGEVGTLTAAQLEMEIGDGQEESSMSDRITVAASSVRGITDGNARKRKAAAKGKAKETPLSYSATYPSNMNSENIDAKRRKATGTNAAGNDAEVKMESEQMANTNQKQGKGSDAKPPESPKDYIHVRARRGQATDAHSLAERVRREKISERMKFLQELVPGCNKVTGKAVMLDEIINYVQSLQRQVEFLSMKLATLNPHHNNIENLLSKEMYQANRPMPPPIYTSDIATAGFSCHHQSQATPIVSSDLEPSFSLSALESQTMQLDAFVDANSQLGEFWGADLESVAQIGFGQNQETAFSQSFHGQTHANHMKLEL